MDWAEIAYPQYFPAHESDLYWAPYTYRFYPETGIYLGVPDGQFVRVFGPQFGPDIITVGVLSDFVCGVFPESCQPPVANAGTSQQVAAGSGVTLDGRASTDPGGHALSFAWTLVSKPIGSTAYLAAPTTALPTFIADLPGTYVAQLVVSNEHMASAASSVTITAVTANVAPVANAGGSRSVVTGSTVALSGSLSSDQNGDALTYQWTLTRPAGSAASIVGNTTVSAYFTPDVAGTYVATLVVHDGHVSSQPATVTITVSVASPPY